MSDTYHKVGTSYRSGFDYVIGTGPVTGLTQASFTIELSKNGANAATTGITITEVSSSTNAGEYAVVASGATGFPSAVGVYDLVIYRTSSTTDRWSDTIRVTTDGSGTGSYGTVSFTAIASNGRIMSGGSPLAGATIRVVSPAGNLVAAMTSSALGLWGPVYFDADGTYAVYVQLGGYTTAASTIVVSGGVTIATGPGADLTITAVSSASGLTASSLWAHFKRVLRDRSGAQADLLAQQGVDDALSMISQEREWPWFHTVYPITFQPTYGTGTITVTNASAVVTLSGGTFPTWAASADLYVGGMWFPVLTRDSDTQVTLATAWGNATASAQTYSIAQCAYTLPTDLMSLDRVLFDQTWAYSPASSSLSLLMAARSAMQFGQARPSMWAIQKDKFVIWPLPTAQTTIELLYYRRPALLTSSTDNADWDPLHIMLLRRAIEYQASLRGDCIVGAPQECLTLYKMALEKAAAFDKTATDRDVSDIDRWTDANWWRGTVSGP